MTHLDGAYSSGSSTVNALSDGSFHLIFNLAIDGRWPEDNALGGALTEGFPKHMEIDRVRVWECDADPQTGRGFSGGN